MSLVKLVASTITLVLLTSAAAAGVIDSSVRHVPADPAGAGYIANDLFIDFEGNLRGQQLWLRLDSGSVYAPPQTDSVCTHLTFCLLDPYRSRVGIGDLHNSAVLIIGGAVDIPGAQGELQIDEEGMSVAWAPGIGVDVASGTNLPIARLTLSPDANGTVWLYSLTSGNGPPFLHGDVVIDGFIGGRIPEPASLLLFGIAVTSTIAVGTITEL